MKRLATILMTGAILLAFASTSMGAIGWCGNIWPNNGVSYTSNDNIDVYVQVWKEDCTGCTNGPCADIEAYLYYRCEGNPDFIEVPMSFNVCDSNNDEFTGQIPAGHGCDVVEYYVMVLDTSDDDQCYGNDQAGNPPNFFLPITEVTGQDVTVRFNLCLTGEIETTGAVCVVGAGDPLTNWGDGVPMFFRCETASPKLYFVDVLFPAGSNPYVEYKYKKDDCVTWEGTGNHNFLIDDSGATMELPLLGWEWSDPDCPECPSPVESATWGTIKALYR